MLSKYLRSLRKHAGAQLRILIASSAGFHLVHSIHRLVFSISLLPSFLVRTNMTQRDGVVIICSPGGGNIGDQALTESATWNSVGPITLVMRMETSFEIPDWLASRDVKKMAVPHLLYGLGFRHLRELVEFIGIARKSRSVIIIGADIMDGCYNATASLNRWSLAVLAQACGAKTSVLGFSWNSTPRASSESGMLKADGVATLWIRDPASYERARALGARHVKLCADIVFAHPARELSTEYKRLPESITQALESFDGYAIVNASSFVGDDEHVRSEYRKIVDEFHRAGMAVVFLPHVMRKGSDLDCLRPLYKKFNGAAILIDTLLSPAQIGELTSGARIVVAGRMHLAVLSSLARTPVLTLATQGKVDGLYELLGRPDWVLDSRSEFSARVNEAHSEIVTDSSEFPQLEAFAKIQGLARIPFD